MNDTKPLQVVDLFAGPGGLGEGFSSLNDGQSFEIVVSAEMDEAAHRTLRLRAFYRALRKLNPDALDEYYDFCQADGLEEPLLVKSKPEWEIAEKEARRICLGSIAGNNELDSVISSELRSHLPWVLIGGPPCQAYSIVGRARNKSKLDYKPEEDHRHFLYKEYLRIIQKNRPAVFVMENVKGILSSKIGGQYIFPQILADLADPDAALGEPDTGRGKYKIYSLSTDEVYVSGQDARKINFKKFVIKAENYGIPQSRHRVILLGVAEEYAEGIEDLTLDEIKQKVSVEEAIGDLPPLRSTITKKHDSNDVWSREIVEHLRSLKKEYSESERLDPKLEHRLNIVQAAFDGGRFNNGKKRLEKGRWCGTTKVPSLDSWYKDPNLSVWLNHEARGHMSSDLKRYLFASIFSEAHSRSPKGHKDFYLPSLAPDHLNWKSGKFSDRFRVQLRKQPATTITSHISKDGHYFIHYDSNQCRSLTVREAARLQTFPDNYFFLGNRTQQFHQVGNAVPPLLASKIARVVEGIVRKNHEHKAKKQIELAFM